MIDRFGKDEFEKALPKTAYLTHDPDEWCYVIPLKNSNHIIVRSSVSKRTGVSDGTGEDSIRIYLMSANDRFVIAKNVLRVSWITRQLGWQDRMRDYINNLAGINSQLYPCKACKNIPQVRVTGSGPNMGRAFAACTVREHRHFSWIDLSVSEDVYADEVIDVENISLGDSSREVVIRKVDNSILNEHQMRVINSLIMKPTVVNASAGSGKTTLSRFLVARLMEEGVRPERMLVVTFSVKAAAELRRRIAQTIWPDLPDRELLFIENPHKETEEDIGLEHPLNREWIEADPIRQMIVDWVCTIHAMSFRMLKTLGFRLKMPDARQTWELDQIIKDALDELHWKQSIKSVKAYIAYGIESLAEDHEMNLVFEEVLRGFDDVDRSAPEYLAEIYMRYMSYMRKHHLVNFAMMQAMLLKLIRNDPYIRQRLSSLFDVVIVDEFQDTDEMQFEILQTISSNTKRLAAIGDVKQSLYRFRGAHPEMMEEQFDQNFPDNNRLGLPINYRSTQKIIEQSDRMISNNYIGREEYFMYSKARPDAPVGDPVDYEHFDSMSGLVGRVLEMVQSKGNFDDWYVLSRTRAECAMIHMGFIAAGIPSKNLSGGNMVGAPHIRKVMAYAKLACNYHGARDDLEILKEIANVASTNFLAPITRKRHEEDCPDKDKGWSRCECPVIMREGRDYSAVRYYGAKSVEAAGSWAGINRQMHETNRGGFLTQAAKGARDLVEFVEHLESMKEDALQCLNTIIQESVLPWLAHEEGIDEHDLAENGKQEDFDVLLRLIENDKWPLEKFIDKVEKLASDVQDSEKGAVHIGTIHAVKGLERNYVVGNTTRLPITPPVRKEGELPVGIPTGIEDERNMAYVMVTRARLECHLVGSADWNGMPAQVSQFVSELGIGQESEQ